MKFKTDAYNDYCKNARLSSPGERLQLILLERIAIALEDIEGQAGELENITDQLRGMS